MTQNEKPPDLKSRLTKKKVGAIASCALWVLSIALSFTIPPSSNLIWLPDAILLVGFFPLLFVWSPSWPWIVFGLFNLSIGFFINIIFCLPDDPFPVQLRSGKHHLTEFHPWQPWMLIGLLATIYGFGRLTKNIVLMVLAKTNKQSTANSTDTDTQTNTTE